MQLTFDRADDPAQPARHAQHPEGEQALGISAATTGAGA